MGKIQKRKDGQSFCPVIATGSEENSIILARSVAIGGGKALEKNEY